MKQEELKNALQTLSINDLHIVLRYVRFRHLRHQILNGLYRVDLWFFPPSAFYSIYIATSNLFPPHPIKLIAILATSFMSATLTLFMLRPPKRRHFHWIKAQ